MLLIAAATALAYSNTFDASFQFDDFPNIVENPGLHDLRNLWPPTGQRWLGFLSFALNYHFGRLEVFGYHLVNLVIHVCNGLLVFWLSAITLRTPAVRDAEAGPLVRGYLPLVAGVLFAVHPIETQAVTYIVQRFASLATLFFLLSLTLYARARLSMDAGHPSKARTACLYCLSVLAAAGAMKTKEISFTLPFVAAGYELLFFRSGRRLLLLVPHAATALLIPFGLAAQGNGLADAIGEAGKPLAGTAAISRSVYLLTQSRVVVTYLRLLLLPVDQNVDYDFRLSSSLAEPSVLFALAILLAVAASAVLFLKRARRMNRAAGALVFFGIAWFFVTLSVESSVIPIGDVIFEHRVYLPSAGFAVALGTALLLAVQRLRLGVALPVQAAVALLITAGPLGVATYARNLVWKDGVTLWSDVVAKSPGKARPHMSLGAAYWAKGRVDDAIRESSEAIRLNPALAQVHGSLCGAYFIKGQLDDAIRECRDAIRLDSGTAEPHNILGGAYLSKGQIDDAMSEYREAIRRAPWDAQPHFNLGNAHNAKGHLDEAMREHLEAIRLDPRNTDALNSLGAILLQQDRAADAVEEYRRALELEPTPETVMNLAIALDRAGRVPDAIAHLQRFLDLAGDTHPDRAREVRARLAQLRAPPKPKSH